MMNANAFTNEITSTNYLLERSNKKFKISDLVPKYRIILDPGQWFG